MLILLPDLTVRNATSKLIQYKYNTPQTPLFFFSMDLFTCSHTYFWGCKFDHN